MRTLSRRDAVICGKEQAAEAVSGKLGVVVGLESEVLRAYLSGLTEQDQTDYRFAAWADHLAGSGTPPSAENLVIPDLGRLEKAVPDMFGDETAAHLADDTAALP